MRYLAPGILDMSNLVIGLERLSDLEYQRKTWLSSGDGPIDTFVESVCDVFDTADLSDYLRRGARPSELDEVVWSVVGELDVAVDEVDDNRPPQEVLDDPRMAKVREVATRLLALLEDRGLTKDIPQPPPDPRVWHRRMPPPSSPRREGRGTFQLLRMGSLVRGLGWMSHLNGPRPAWLPAEGPVVPPIIEAEHVTFMVSNLYFHLREGGCPEQFDGRTWAAAMELDAALYEVDYGMEPEELVEDSKVTNVCMLAAGLLALLEVRGLTEGVSGESEELEGRGWTQAILGNPNASEK